MNNIYGVDGEHGSDTNSGLLTINPDGSINWTNAWKTIQKALDVVLSYGTIYIRGNADNSERLVYDENLTTKRGTNLDILWSEDYEEYTLYGDGITLQGIGDKPILKNNSGSYVINISHSGYVCKNIELNNLETSNQYLFNVSFIQNWIFIDCIFNAKNRGFYYYNHCNNWNFINCVHNSDTNNVYGIFYGAVNRNWNWIVFKDCETNIENPTFDTVVDVININSFKNLQSINLIRTGQKYIKTLSKNISGSTSIRFNSEKSILKNIATLFPDTMILRRSTIISPIINLKKGFVIKNSILWWEDEIIYSGSSEVTFVNCISRNFPINAELINCVTTDNIKFTDPLNDDYSLQADSPARKVNWTGPIPIKDDLGAIPYHHTPELYGIYVLGNSGKIPISIGVKDDEKIIELEIMYSVDGGETWSDCTIEYNSGIFGIAGEAGIVNDFLWNTTIDIPGIEDVILRIKGFDGNKYSDYLYSSPISIDNINIFLDVKWLTPLKFRLEDDTKLYFKLEREKFN